LERIIELIGNKHGAGKELSSFLGIHPSVITDWKAERNKSYTKYAPQIAEYYGVSLDWLSGNSDQKEKLATNRDELTDDEKYFLSLIKQLPPEQLSMVSAQIEGLLRRQ